MIFQISCFFIRCAELDKSVTTIQYMKSFFMRIKISKKSLMVTLFRVNCVPVLVQVKINKKKSYGNDFSDLLCSLIKVRQDCLFRTAV